MDLSIILVLLLSLATSMAAPKAPATEDTLFTLLSSSTDAHSPMVGNLVVASDQTIKPESIAALKEALTTKVKSELMTSLAALTPELSSTAGFAGTNELSQLNLSSGINNLVKGIVEKLLEVLMPRIFGQRPAPTPTPVPAPTPGFTGGFNLPGIFGPLGSMGMMGFSLLNNMFDFI